MKAFASSLAAAALVAGLASLLSVVALPAVAQTQSDAAIHQKYLADRAACLSGRTGEDQQTCLREAGAAAQAARQGKLVESPDENFRRNALARCAPLPPEQREACRMRIEGAGTVTGSVEGGGLFRELTIREPAPQATTAPAMAPPATPSPATGTASTTIVPASPETPSVVVPGTPSANVAPAPAAAPPVGSVGGPTFTPVQPIVPGRAAPAASTAPVPAPSVQSAADGAGTSSLQITPPSTPVMEAPPAPTYTLQPAVPSPAPAPVLVAPGSVPPGGAR